MGSKSKGSEFSEMVQSAVWNRRVFKPQQGPISTGQQESLFRLGFSSEKISQIKSGEQSSLLIAGRIRHLVKTLRGLGHTVLPRDITGIAAIVELISSLDLFPEDL